MRIESILEDILTRLYIERHCMKTCNKYNFKESLNNELIYLVVDLLEYTIKLIEIKNFISNLSYC